MGLLALVNLAINVLLCLSYTALSSFLPPERPKQNDTVHSFFYSSCSFAQRELEKVKQRRVVSMNVLIVKLFNYWFL